MIGPFQSTPSGEGERFVYVKSVRQNDFNPLPRERENGNVGIFGDFNVDFNPLPRERENNIQNIA